MSTHVAAVAEALLATWRVGDDLTSQAMAFQASRRDATVAVETLTPLIRAQVAAEIRAHAEAGENAPGRAFGSGLRTAARIAEGTP